MEEKYGKKVATLKLSGMIYLPLVMVSLIFFVVFLATLISAIRGNSKVMAIAIVAGIGLVVCIVGLLRQILTVRMDIYDKHLVEVKMLGTNVIAAEDLRAIIWQFPGANPMNSRAARVNNTSAECIFKDGRKTVKVQDSYYQEMEKNISAFQTRNNIPKDLEVQKKGGRRYDNI